MGHGSGPLAYVSGHDMALTPEHSALLAEPRPDRYSLSGLLADVGINQITRTRTNLDGAHSYMLHERHVERRLAVSLDCGAIYVETPEGGLDPEPVADLREVFGIGPAFEHGPTSPTMRVALRPCDRGAAVTCLRMAFGTTYRNASTMLAEGVFDLAPKVLTELLLAAVVVAGGRRAVVRGRLRRSDLPEWSPCGILGLCPAT